MSASRWWIFLAVLALQVAAPWAWSQEADRPTVPVYIEDSPAAQELAAEAQQRIEQQRQTEAVELLQSIVDSFPHKLMQEGPRRYTDAVLWVRRHLLASPGLLDTYRQVYGPAAERAYGEAKDAGDLLAMETVVRRFVLTDAGLEAGLALAAMHLERADPSSAAVVLDQLTDHPRLAGEGAASDAAVQYHTLQAMTGVLTLDAPRTAEHRAALEARSASEALQAIDELALGLNPPLRLRQATEPTPLDLSELPSGKRDPLWTVRLAEAPGPDLDRVQRAAGQNATAAVLPVLPTASGNDLFVNDGWGVVALDRTSGRERWTYVWPHRPDERLANLVRMRRTVTDSRGVLAGPERLWAVLGRASSWPNRITGEEADTALVALNRATGEKLWSASPQQLDASLERADFLGTPVADYGQVLALVVRRSQMSGFQDTFVVALDAETGTLRWKRHISSTVTSNRHAQTPMPSLVRAGSRVIVSDNLGAVAALDARSGLAQWVRVLAESEADSRRGVKLPGDAAIEAAPVAVPAGLVVPTANTNARITLLDPDSGATRRDLDVEPFNTADRFVAAGDDLLGVGRTVTLYDGQTLEPRWSVTLGERREDEPAGRPAVTEKHVLLSTLDRVVALDRATGERQWMVYTADPAHLLALPGQVVAATSGEVRGYLGWERAQADLLRQMRESPDDPDPGLALAYLAVRAGPADAALRGVDHALAALAPMQPDADSDRLARGYSQLLDLARPGSLASPSLRGAILDRLATAPVGPAQEAAYHFVRGAHLEQQQRPREAVEQYQTVLLDPSLSRQLFVDGTTFRQAELEAQRRIEDLVGRFGPPVYETYEIEAARQVTQLLQRRATAEELSELARRYPLASTASVALLHAARQHREAGDAKEALRELRRAYSRARDARLIGSIAGTMAQVLQDLDQPLRAGRWLRRVKREHPGIDPVRDGQVLAMDAWLDELDRAQPVKRERRAIRVPLGEPALVAGRLLAPSQQDPMDLPEDRFVVRTPGGLAMLDLATLEPTWRQALGVEDPELLSLSREQVLLIDRASDRLLGLSAESGASNWPAVDLRPLLAELGENDVGIAARTREQREFVQQMVDVAPLIMQARRQGRAEPPDAENAEPLRVGIGDGVVVVGDASGRVVGLDRRTGRPLWQHRSELGELRVLSVGDGAVALGGVAFAGTETRAEAVVVLDVVTGERRLGMIEENQPIAFAGLTDDGLLVTVGPKQVTARHVADGSVAWRLQAPGQPLREVLSSGPLMITVMDQVGLLHAIDTQTGEHLGRLPARSGQGENPLQVQRVEGRWHVLTPLEAMAVSDEGKTLWRDAISLFGSKRLVTQWIGEHHVIVAAHIASDEAGPLDPHPLLRGPALPESPVLGLFVMDRATGSLIEERFLGPLPAPLDPKSAQLLGNALLAATADATLVVPGAPADAR